MTNATNLFFYFDHGGKPKYYVSIKATDMKRRRDNAALSYLRERLGWGRFCGAIEALNGMIQGPEIDNYR